VAGTSTSAQLANGESVRSYSTTFQLDEDPLSEGGIWVNGKKDGIDWIDVIARNGVAYGAVSRMGAAERRVEQGNLDPDAAAAGAAPEGDYDDPTAVLAGPWGRNQHGAARVFSRNQTEEYFQEVEIRLRSTIKEHYCTGYEVFFRCLKNENAYAEIARWNGKRGDFTSLAKHVGPEFGVEEGDLIEGRIVGNLITGYINGTQVIEASDDMFAEGSPGIGFNFGVGDTNTDHGLTYFAVNTWNE
jgi:hypothetical protein